jgi:hypothetical protein
MNRRRKILTVAGAALVAAALIPVTHHYQLRATTEAYIAELKAKGEPMKLSQVIPPPMPPEQNSADTFREAVALFEADRSLLTTNSCSAMKMVAPGKAMICWQQPDVRGFDATNSWQEITAAVTQNAKSFALLQRIIDKPDFDFQIKYESGFAGFNFTNLYLIESKRAAQRLKSAALCDLHEGDTASAVKNLRAMLALAKALRDERFAISELVRIAIAQIALTVNWELLQSPDLTDEQLAELQQDWLSLDFIQGDANALGMERVSEEIPLAKWRNSTSEVQHYFGLEEKARESMGLAGGKGTIWDRAKITAKIFMWRYWWSYPDELRALNGYEVLINTAQFAQTNGSFQSALQYQNTKLEELGISKLDDEFLALFSNEMDFHSMLSQSVLSLSGVFNKVMSVETAKQVTVTAIALKRYQIKHGNYPRDLNSLVPEFVPTVPLDPVDGNPLRYRLKADGAFTLYSVGENGKDDGGDPSLEKGVQSSSFYWQNPHALDWVWPRPATPEEVENFYEHPPK